MSAFNLTTFIDKWLANAADTIMLLMVAAFFVGLVMRWLVQFTMKRQAWFAEEFEKRVTRYIENDNGSEKVSFFVSSKRLLEKTFYEAFEMREKLGRRRGDKSVAMSDRVFLIKPGAAWIVSDLLRQVKHLRYSDQQPKLLNITKNTFMNNPHYNRIFGIIPISGTNDILNILPGLFVISGILGTFLGIVKGLPALGAMDIADMAQTKRTMDEFLAHIAYSMHTSVIGILCSVLMSINNTLFAPERVYVQMVDRFERALDILWNRSNNNEVPADMQKFNEHRDPIEALAEAALTSELGKTHRTRDMDNVRKKKEAS